MPAKPNHAAIDRLRKRLESAPDSTTHVPVSVAVLRHLLAEPSASSGETKPSSGETKSGSGEKKPATKSRRSA